MAPESLRNLTQRLAAEAGEYAQSQTSDPVEQHRIMLERLVSLARVDARADVLEVIGGLANIARTRIRSEWRDGYLSATGATAYFVQLQEDV